MVLTHHNVEFEGLLYPLMVIAAVAVVVFSVLGIASVSGWFPSALQSAPVQISAPAPHPEGVAAFACAECGVIESLHRAAEDSSQ